MKLKLGNMIVMSQEELDNTVQIAITKSERQKYYAKKAGKRLSNVNHWICKPRKAIP